MRSVANAERLARRVRGLFVPPFMLGELPLHVDTSVGVACLPDHATDSSSLMRTADVAMYAAKHQRTGVSVYSADQDDSSPARLVLLGDLHRALTPRPARPRELRMHYQPKIELATGRTVGLEALMRWVHPTRGVLPPTTFIPLAEQSGLIHDVTRFALTECVVQLAAWREEGRATPVAVNLSAHDVTTGAVVDLIEALLEEHLVPADLLEVEITETALVSDPSRVVPVLERLGALGIRVAIDDFGIGNTSISQLRDLPVDELKIDRLFVSDLGVDGRDGSEVIVQAMVDLAHSFDLRVVAEGVEDEPTAVILRRLGVDQAQGFLYSQAVPADDLPMTQSVPRPGASAARAAGRPGDTHRQHASRARPTRVGDRQRDRVSIVRSSQVGPRGADTTVSTHARGGYPHDGRPAPGDDRPRPGAARRTAAAPPVDDRRDRRSRRRRGHHPDDVGHLHRQRRGLGLDLHRHRRPRPRQPASFAFDSVNLAPGDATYAPLEVRSDGSLALRYSISYKARVTPSGVPSPTLSPAPTAGDLRDILQLSVYATPQANCNAANIGAATPVALDPAVAGNPWPDTSAPLVGSSAQGQQTGDRVLPVGSASEWLCFKVVLPLLPADNSYQGAGATLDLTFNAEQVVNNP